ncbi:MAG: AarF/UbiB family protein [Xenococcus sp. (in: cyanobacteria)]
MTFNLGSIEIQIEATRRQLDKIISSAERDKARLEANPINLTFNVNTAQLYAAQTQIETAKNRFRNAQDYFNTNPLTPKVDTSNLDKLDAKLSKYENKTFKVKVEVDDSRLTDLNAHYTVKEQHHSRVVQKLKSEPLTPKVDYSKMGGQKAQKTVRVIHQFDTKESKTTFLNDLKTISQTLRPINGLLRQIANNTKKPGLISRTIGGLTNAVLGNATRGLFMQFGEQFARQITREVSKSSGGKKAAETTRKLAQRTGEIAGNAAGQYSEIFFGGSRRRGDAVETMGNDILNVIETIVDPSKLDRKAGDIRKKIFEIFTKVDAGMLDSLGAVQEIGTSLFNQNQRFARNAVFRTAQVGSLPLKVQKEYQTARIARIIEEFASNLERARRLIGKNPQVADLEKAKNILIPFGGHERKKGTASQQLSEMLRPFFSEDTAFLEVKNKFTDRYGGEPQSKVFDLIKSVLEPIGVSVAGEIKSMVSNLEIELESAFKGMNTDAIRGDLINASVQALYPDKNVAFVGFSGGAYPVEQAVNLSEARGKTTPGLAIGGPFFGLTNTADPKYFKSLLGYTDPISTGIDKEFAGYPDSLINKAKGKMEEKGLDPRFSEFEIFQIPEFVQLIGKTKAINHDVWSYLQNPEGYQAMSSMLPGMMPELSKVSTSSLPKDLQDKYQDILPEIEGIDDPVFGSRKNKVLITRIAKANAQIAPNLPNYNLDKIEAIAKKDPEKRTIKETKTINAYIVNSSEQFLKTFGDFENELYNNLSTSANKLAKNIAKKKGITNRGQISQLKSQINDFFTDYLDLTGFKKNLDINKARSLKILEPSINKALDEKGIDYSNLTGVQKTGLINYIGKRESDDINLLRGLDIYKNGGTSDIKSNYEFFNFVNPKAKIDLEMDGMREYVVEANKKALQGSEYEELSTKYARFWENIHAALARFVSEGIAVPEQLLTAAEKILTAKDKLADFEFPDLIKSGELKAPEKYFDGLKEGAKKISIPSNSKREKLSGFERRNLAELNRRIAQNNRDNPAQQIPFVRVRDTVPLGIGMNAISVLEKGTSRVIKFPAPDTDPTRNALSGISQTFPQALATTNFISRFLPEHNVAAGFPNELDNITRASSAGLTKPLPNDQVEGFMMMQLQEGQPLVNAAQALKGSDSEEIIRFLESIVRAGALLREFHSSGLVHRDLHLNNVFQTESGKIAPIDFGAMGELPTDGRERNIAIAEDVQRAIKHSQGLLAGEGININPSLLGEAYRRGVREETVSINEADSNSRSIAEKLYQKYSPNLLNTVETVDSKPKGVVKKAEVNQVEKAVSNKVERVRPMTEVVTRLDTIISLLQGWNGTPTATKNRTNTPTQPPVVTTETAPGAIAKQVAKNAAISTLDNSLAVGQGAYGVAKGVENFVLDVLPVGHTSKKVIQTVAPAVGLGALAATNPVAGSVMGEAVNLSQGLLMPVVDAIGSGVSANIASTVGSLPFWGASSMGTALGGLAEGGLSALGAGATTALPFVLGGNAAKESVKALTGSATKLLPESTQKQLDSSSFETIQAETERALKKLSEGAKRLREASVAIQKVKTVSELMSYVNTFNNIVDVAYEDIKDNKALASSDKERRKFSNRKGQITKARTNFLENALTTARRLGVDPNVIDAQILKEIKPLPAIGEVPRLPAAKDTLDLSGNADKSAKHWQDTTQSIEKNLTDLETKTDAIGYEIQKDISEGSPGTTQRIRAHWEKTTKALQKNLLEIQRQALTSGTKIEKIFQANPQLFATLQDQINAIEAVTNKLGDDEFINFHLNLDESDLGSLETFFQGQNATTQAFGYGVDPKLLIRPDLSRNGDPLHGLENAKEFYDATIDHLPDSVQIGKAVKGFVDEMSKASPVFKNILGFGGQLATLAVAGFGLHTATQVMGNFTRESVESARNLERFEILMAGVGRNGNKVFNEIYSDSQKIGSSFTEARAGYQRLFLSTQGTEGESLVDPVFSGFQKAFASTQATREQQQRGYLAIQQIIDKGGLDGSVSSEELKLQLGEALPGAMTTAAIVRGQSTKELQEDLRNANVAAGDLLTKMSAFYEVDREIILKIASTSFEAELNRLDNNLEMFRAKAGKSLLPVGKQGLRATNAGISLLANNMEVVSTISGGVLLLALKSIVTAMYQVTMSTRLGTVAMKAFGIESLIAINKANGGGLKGGLATSWYLGHNVVKAAKPILGTGLAVAGAKTIYDEHFGGQESIKEAYKISRNISEKPKTILGRQRSEGTKEVLYNNRIGNTAQNDINRITKGSNNFIQELERIDSNLDSTQIKDISKELTNISHQIAVLKGERLRLVTEGETDKLKEIDTQIGELRKKSQETSKELYSNLAQAQRIQKGYKTFQAGLEGIKSFVPKPIYNQTSELIQDGLTRSESTINSTQSLIDQTEGKQLTYLSRRINRELGNVEYKLNIDIADKSSKNIRKKIGGLLTERELQIANTRVDLEASRSKRDKLFAKRDELRAGFEADQLNAVRSLLGVGETEDFFAALDRLGTSSTEIEDLLTGTEDPLLNNVLPAIQREREVNQQATQERSNAANLAEQDLKQTRELERFNASRPTLQTQANLESQLSQINLAGDIDQLRTNFQLLNGEIPLASNNLHTLRNDISTLKDTAAAREGAVRDISKNIDDYSSDSRETLGELLGTDNLIEYARTNTPEAIEQHLQALKEELRREIEKSGEIQGLTDDIKALSGANVESRRAKLESSNKGIQLKQVIQDYESQLFSQLQQLETSIISNDQTLFQQSRSIEQFVWSLSDYSFSIDQAITSLRIQIRKINAATTQAQITTPETFFNAAGINNPLVKYMSSVSGLIGQAEQIAVNNQVDPLVKERREQVRSLDRQQRQFRYQREDLGFSINNERQTTVNANRQLQREYDLFLGKEQITSEEAEQYKSYLQQRIAESNEQTGNIRQLGRDTYTPLAISPLAFSEIFGNADPNDDSLRVAVGEGFKALIENNNQKLIGLDKISDTGFAQISEKELEQREKHNEKMKVFDEQIEGYRQQRAAEERKLAARIEGTAVALEKMLSLGASGIEIQKNQQEFRTRDVILQANRGFYYNLNQENIGEYAQLKTKNSIDTQLQQLKGKEIETDALLSAIDLGTTKDDFLAKINDPSNITSPELKQKLNNLLNDPEFDGNFEKIIKALNDFQANTKKNIDRLETEAPGLIENSGVLAEEQQRLRINQSLIGARKGIFEEQKKAKILDPFELAELERELGKLQIDLDHKSQLSNARKQFGALTEEFETAKRLLEELRDIKLDNLERQTSVISKTLEDSVSAGFGKFLDGFKDGIDGLDELWRNFGIGFLEVWSNVAQQVAQQKLIEFLFPRKGNDNNGVGGVGGFVGDVVGNLFTANDGLILEQKHIPNFYNGSGMNPLSLYAGVQDAYRREQAAGGQPVLVMASVGERVLNPLETKNYNKMESQGILDSWDAAGIKPTNYKINNYRGGGNIGKSISNAFSNYTNNNNSNSNSRDSHDTYNYNVNNRNSRRDRLGRSKEQQTNDAFERMRRKRKQEGLD